MLKVRYFRVRLPFSLSEFGELAIAGRGQSATSRVAVAGRSEKEVILRYHVTRLITTYQILSDGTQVQEQVPTMEIHSIRLFQRGEDLFLCIVDPPRGLKLIGELLEAVLGSSDYFFEPLTLTTAMIQRHVSKFETARLVSAKVRDFQVYEGAIGRLEITSQGGLQPEIAPFLKDKFHRIDALTYDVTVGFAQGLVYYSSNGTIRASAPLVEVAFPTFEASL